MTNLKWHKAPHGYVTTTAIDVDGVYQSVEFCVYRVPMDVGPDQWAYEFSLAGGDVKPAQDYFRTMGDAKVAVMVLVEYGLTKHPDFGLCAR